LNLKSLLLGRASLQPLVPLQSDALGYALFAAAASYVGFFQLLPMTAEEPLKLCALALFMMGLLLVHALLGW
jgi:hypothetical protein